MKGPGGSLEAVFGYVQTQAFLSYPCKLMLMPLRLRQWQWFYMSRNGYRVGDKFELTR